MEAEYIALALAATEALKLYNLLVHIVGRDNVVEPIEFHCDSQGAIADATHKHGVHTKHTAHIANNYHFFRQYVEEGFFMLHYVKSNFNVADYLTKPLHGELFARLTKSAMEA